MAFGLFVFRCLSARTVSCETPATSMLWCVLLASNACDVRHVRHDRLNACELTFSQRTCHLCYLPLCGLAMFVHQGYEGLLCGVGYCCFEPWSMLSSSPTWQPGHRKLLNLGYLHQWRVAGVSENWSWVLMSYSVRYGHSNWHPWRQTPNILPVSSSHMPHCSSWMNHSVRPRQQQRLNYLEITKYSIFPLDEVFFLV